MKRSVKFFATLTAVATLTLAIGTTALAAAPGNRDNNQGGFVGQGQVNQMPQMGQSRQGRVNQMPQMGQSRQEQADQMPQMNPGQEGQMPQMEQRQQGQMPQGQPPEFTEGEMPEFTEGEMPEFAEGEMPEFTEGEMPEFTEGEMPQGEMFGGKQMGPMMNLESIEAQIDALEDEDAKAELTELLEAYKAALEAGLSFEDGELPELEDGELPEITEGEAPTFDEDSEVKAAEEALLEALENAGIELEELENNEQFTPNDGGFVPEITDNNFASRAEKPLISSNRADAAATNDDNGSGFFPRIGNWFKSLFN